jgi:hypothetical protein
MIKFETVIVYPNNSRFLLSCNTNAIFKKRGIQMIYLHKFKVLSQHTDVHIEAVYIEIKCGYKVII